MNDFTGDRTILHCDMNNFFASVELLTHPELSGLPVAVCGNPKDRHGIILAKNQVAKDWGIMTAETLWQAKRKCPGLRTLPPHMEKYTDFSSKINRIYLEYTDQVEPFSIDESWLDVTNSSLLFGDGASIGDELRSRIKKELGLTLSVGVSFNKIFAKLGSDYQKPDATTLITRENYTSILWPLPILDMFFVGRASAEKLKQNGIHTIGDLALADPSLLTRLLGKSGSQLSSYARGEDESPVLTPQEKGPAKSMGNGMTFPSDLRGLSEISNGLLVLADKVSSRLRKSGVRAGGLRLEIKGSDFRSISRQTQFDVPLEDAQSLRDAALCMVQGTWDMAKPVRLLQLTAINLKEGPCQEQMGIWDKGTPLREKNESLGQAMDQVRQRFGKSAIHFFSILPDETPQEDFEDTDD